MKIQETIAKTLEKLLKQMEPQKTSSMTKGKVVKVPL
jgi:hypothetical protein